MNFKYGLVLLSALLSLNNVFAASEAPKPENPKTQTNADIIVNFLKEADSQQSEKAKEFIKAVFSLSYNSDQISNGALQSLAKRVKEDSEGVWKLLQNHVICDNRLYTKQEFNKATSGFVSEKSFDSLMKMTPEAWAIAEATKKELK